MASIKRRHKRKVNQHKDRAELMLHDLEFEFYKELFLSDNDENVFDKYNEKWLEIVAKNNKAKKDKYKKLNPLAFYNANINQKVNDNHAICRFSNSQLNYVCWLV